MPKKKSKPTERSELIADVIGSVNSRIEGAPLSKLSSSSGGDLTIPIPGVYSTGFESIDAAWGRGGIPWGRITIFHGKESGGKTTVGLTTLASAQRDGAICLFADAEHKLDLSWAAKKCGVDLEELILSQPDYLEKALETIEETMNRVHKAGLRSFVILDSMNACQSREEFENSYEDESHYGPKAKVYSRILPKLVPTVKKTESALILVSQIRGGPQGNHIACGNAPKFFSSCIASFYRPKSYKIEKAGRIVGVNLEVEFVKNQISAPYQKASFQITDGPDFDQSLLDAAISKGFVSKGGAGWMDTIIDGEELKFRGVTGWRKLTSERPELEGELRKKVRAGYAATSE